ncbi:MAG: hypothetical protein ABI442_10155 [Gemmatimonadaceae bacterium]
MKRLLNACALAAVAVAAASCSDSTTGPVVEQARAISPFSAAFDNANAPGGQGQVITSNFTVTSSGGTFTILNGRYKVTVPADAVCEPTTSTYGATEWNQPCDTLAPGRQIAIHAVLSSSGGMGVDFSPALRFSPSKVVTIGTDQFANTLKQNVAYYQTHVSLLNYLPIYSLGGGASSVDFGTDPSLITHVDFNTGSVWRRVKHFSGYYLSSGQPCNPSPDVPDCVQVDGLR